VPDIHFGFAKNSELTFTVDGRHLCSSHNPTREAQSWVIDHRAELENCEGVIVLGVGCGYHIRALMTTLQIQVVVVEAHRSIAEASLRAHPLDLSEANVVVAADLTTVRESRVLKTLTTKSYAVIGFEPSFAQSPEFYRAARTFMLGRSVEGLAWLFGNRGMSLPHRIENRGGVSLKALDGDLQLQREGRAPLQPLLQALRELIV
jgi:hypothetical protein